MRLQINYVVVPLRGVIGDVNESILIYSDDFRVGDII